jgi:hypothetical protein
MATIPCTECKFKAERQEGHRTFVRCADKEREKGFNYDDWLYRHSCRNYEKE